MGKVIEVSKTISRSELDKKLVELKSTRKRIDLKKYFGKIDFQIDGLDYQLMIRNEWK